VEEKVGAIDVVINNAGVVNTSRMLDDDDRAIERVFQVNTFAHFWVRLPTLTFAF